MLIPMNIPADRTPHTIAAALLAASRRSRPILTVALPLLSGDKLDKRMRAVASERERIRAREREKLSNAASQKACATPGAKGLHEARRRPLQPAELARHRQGQGADARDGGYRGAQAEVGVPVLPARLADRLRSSRRRGLHLFGASRNFAWPLPLKVAAS